MNRWVSRYSRKVRNATWEARLNVRTHGADYSGTHPDSVEYQALPYPAIWAILKRLRLGPDDVFVDVGCGKGRVVCCAARLDIRDAMGVEVHPRLTRLALRNAGRLRGRRADISIIEAPAELVDFTGATAFLLFNPFGESTCRMVAHSIREAALRQGRPARVAYVLPRHRQAFEGSNGFELYDSWGPRPDLLLDHPVFFLRAGGRAGVTSQPGPEPNGSSGSRRRVARSG